MGQREIGSGFLVVTGVMNLFVFLIGMMGNRIILIISFMDRFVSIVWRNIRMGSGMINDVIRILMLIFVRLGGTTTLTIVFPTNVSTVAVSMALIPILAHVMLAGMVSSVITISRLLQRSKLLC